MKKKWIILISAIAVIFVLSLFFAKPLIGEFLLKETNITYSQRQPETVTLNKGDYVLFGKYLDENILWKVVEVENTKPLLQTEYIITFKCFDAAHGDETDIGRLGKAQWETCTLNKWLNSRGKVDYGKVVPNEKGVLNGKNNYENELGFLSESNFTKNQVSLISQEGFFLLSKGQLEKLSSKERMKTASKSAILQDESSYIILSGRKIWYWTTTAAGTNRTSVTTVNSNGGFYKSSAFDGVTGVAPALYFNQNSLTSISGDGSREKPYVIN